MVKLSLLGASLGALAVTNAANTYQVKAHTPAAFAERSPDEIAKNVINLKRHNPGKPSRSHQLLRGAIIRERQKKLAKRFDVINLGAPTTDPLYEAENGVEFLTNIRFNGQHFEVIVDTGSSDTWLVSSGFQCVDLYAGTPVDPSTCGFGPTWTPGSAFAPIANENFNISYGDGEFLTGAVGNEHLIFADIPIAKQTVAAVTTAGWEGDGISSGIVGLAYPALTSAFSGSDPDADTNANREAYNPIFTTMYEQNLTKPVFSLAIDRGTQLGVMAFGGVPNIKYEPLASTPIQYLLYQGETTKVHQFYSIQVGVNFPGVEDVTDYQAVHAPFERPADGATIQAIVDSGTTLLYLPTAISDAFNGQFSPPATFDDATGAYDVDCDATVPALSIIVNGTSLPIDARDLVVDNGNGNCISGVNDAGESLSILGDVFLKNVLAVFDVGAAEMRFGARSY